MVKNVTQDKKNVTVISILVSVKKNNKTLCIWGRLCLDERENISERAVINFSNEINYWFIVGGHCCLVFYEMRINNSMLIVVSVLWLKVLWGNGFSKEKAKKILPATILRRPTACLCLQIGWDKIMKGIFRKKWCETKITTDHIVLHFLESSIHFWSVD